jgi:hypothetical protein
VTIHAKTETWFGKPIRDWNAEQSIDDPAACIYRIELSEDRDDEDQTWLDVFASFLADPKSGEVTALIVGNWGYDDMLESSEDVVQALVAAREQLPNLRVLFLGDVTFTECEMSWINQSDVSPLFSAYPKLEHFRIRGASNLSFGNLQHDRLKSLAVETGGMPLQLLNEALGAQLPELEHLELWLGSSEYGWNGQVENLAPLLAGELFPNLTYLGLRNSEITDQIAAALAASPIMERLRTLDLSLGTLGDEGMEALLGNPYLTRLEKLDLHHHYLSPQMVYRLTGAQSEGIELEAPIIETSVPPLGTQIQLDVSDPKQEDEYDGERHRYVSVGE